MLRQCKACCAHQHYVPCPEIEVNGERVCAFSQVALSRMQVAQPTNGSFALMLLRTMRSQLLHCLVGLQLKGSVQGLMPV
jgi:hypothetical protein